MSKPECAHEHSPLAPQSLVSQDSLERAAAMFRALGDPARLRLLEYLANGERCVSELASETEQEISTISQRLKVLRSERLIDRRRQGKHIYYSLCDQHVVDLVRSALEHAQEHEQRGEHHHG